MEKFGQEAASGNLGMRLVYFQKEKVRVKEAQSKRTGDKNDVKEKSRHQIKYSTQ
jgi:hypothetical protein